MNSAELYGIVVTYHPDQDVSDNLRAMVAECGRLLVIDNGSSPSSLTVLKAIPGVELIALGANLGVATALNIGARRALELGGQWAVTFDQDSRPRAGMVAEMWKTHLQIPRAAIIGPMIMERCAAVSGYRWVRQNPKWKWLYQRVATSGADLSNVTMVVTSGSMMELATWMRLGGFDDELFIDYVDVDYCLRVVQAGRTNAVSAGAKLDHRLGARQSGRLLGRDFRPTHHPPFRHYYISRNRVRLWFRHGFRVPHWLVFDAIFAVYNLIRVLIWESAKLEKIGATLRGTFDGLMDSSGPMPR